MATLREALLGNAARDTVPHAEGVSATVPTAPKSAAPSANQPADVRKVDRPDRAAEPIAAKAPQPDRPLPKGVTYPTAQDDANRERRIASRRAEEHERLLVQREGEILLRKRDLESYLIGAGYDDGGHLHHLKLLGTAERAAERQRALIAHYRRLAGQSV